MSVLNLSQKAKITNKKNISQKPSFFDQEETGNQKYAASLNLGPLTSHLLWKTKIKITQPFKPTNHPLLSKPRAARRYATPQALSALLMSKSQGAIKYATPWTLNPLLVSSPKEPESTQLFTPPPPAVV